MVVETKKVFTYTHSWRDIPRETWGVKISVLASCETVPQALEAMGRGYAAALVVGEHPQDGRVWYPHGSGGGIRVIPCPEQTRGVTCRECRLCMRDGLLKGIRAVIAFAAHGGRKRDVQKLVRIGELAPRAN